MTYIIIKPVGFYWPYQVGLRTAEGEEEVEEVSKSDKISGDGEGKKQ